MIITIPVCQKDQEAALRNLNWCKELDGGCNFPCLISTEIGFDASKVIVAARSYFSAVQLFQYPAFPKFSNQKWPRPQNWAWRKLALHIVRAYRDPWLWWEQDAVPLKPNWLAMLQAEYAQNGKPFMGAIGAKQAPNQENHLNGVAIYPANWSAYCPESMLYSDALPFDVCGGWRVLKAASITPLIQHLWSFENHAGGAPCSFPNHTWLSHVSKQAVLFHRCKDGSLIEQLRQYPLRERKQRSLVPKRRMRRKGDRTPRSVIEQFSKTNDVTVVITNFGRADFLWKAFNSCLSAGVKNIVVTSSGATEQIEAIHEQMIQALPEVCIVSEREDSGSNQNWLRGVSAANTEWVQILHDDDMLLPNYLSVLPQLSRVDFACWNALTHGYGHGICRIFQGLTFGFHQGREIMPYLKAGKLTPSPVAGCFRKSHLEEVLSACQDLGPEFYYRDRLLVGNDLLIWLSAARKGWKFAYLPTNLTSFGCHPGSATVNSIQSKDGKLFDIYARTHKLFESGEFFRLLDSSRDKLDLPNVTLVGVDSWHPLRTLRSMREALGRIAPADAVLVTTRQAKPLINGVKVLDLLAGKDRLERERFLITRIGDAFSTSHCLHIESDAGIRNLDEWDDDWLKYDYIGAPWHYPAVFHNKYAVTSENCVGNLGFSLISKKLASVLASLPEPTDEEATASDVFLSIGLREKLVELGVKFAPESVALRFSCECRPYCGQFGWHGSITAKMNGWQL